MIIINPFFSLWIQLSSFSFFLAGNFSDLLIIRICLSSAYVFLFTNSLLGSPLWGSWHRADHLQLDGIFWACLNLYVHLSTVVRLLLDERPIHLRHEKLWRMFYRTGGLSQKLFQLTIDPYCEQVTYHQGETIPIDHGDDDDDDDDDDKQTDAPAADNQGRKWFYIVYSGKVQLTVSADQKVNKKSEDNHRQNQLYRTTRISQSGMMFDFRSLGFLNDAVADTQAQLQNSKGHGWTKLTSAVALSPQVVLFRFPAPLMETKIACHPTTRLMWKELLMETLWRIVQRHFHRQQQQKSTTTAANLSRNASAMQDDINPIFWPLEESEEPQAWYAGSGVALKRPFYHIAQSMKFSFTPPWPWKGFPTGLRHKLYLQAPAIRQTCQPDKKSEVETVKSEDDPNVSWDGISTETDEEIADPEKQGLLSPSFEIPLDDDGGHRAKGKRRRRRKRDRVGNYDSVATTFANQEDVDFMQYLNEMDEDSGQGLDISFFSSSSVSSFGSSNGPPSPIRP